jgi:hypothetical protein
MTTYSPATTNEIDVDVEIPTVVCQLTGVANLSTAYVNEEFAISGVLTAADGSIPAGQTIQLQVRTDDGFVDVPDATAVTDADGAYSISLSETKAGMYAFQAVYAGGVV